MSTNMLPDQSPFARSGLPVPDSDFLGLQLHDEDNLWGLGPISPALPQGFGNPNIERDLKNSHVRNGQPTPPPFDDKHPSQDPNHNIYPPLPQYQLGITPPFPDRGQRRSFSAQSGLDDDYSYSGGASSSSNNSNPKRRKLRGTAASNIHPVDFDDSPRYPERAKREKFLERNRLAASKCRQKKKEHTQQLEARYKEQSDKKEQLIMEISRLRSEILGLKNEVLRHAQCGDEPIKLHLAQMVKNITYNDTSTTMPDFSDAAEHVSTSEEPPTPTAQHRQHHRHHQPGMMSFGFDDALQMEPSAAASLEQQMRRDSEASMMSQGSYAFHSATDDGFDDLINV